MDENILGKRMRNIREKRNEKAKDVAKNINISAFQLSRYESGKSKPDPSLIVKFAEYYNVTTDYLLGHSNHPGLSEQEDKDADREVKELLETLEKMPEKEREEMKKRILAYAKGLSDASKKD